MSLSIVPNNARAAQVSVNLSKGSLNGAPAYLPQSVVIIGEANTANQEGLSSVPLQVTSAKQVGTVYGYGSPLHAVSRILFGGGVQVPVWIIAQATTDEDFTPKVITVTPTGIATKSATIYLKVCGREFIDGGTYAVNIAKGDGETAICNKMRTAVASCLSSPVIGSGTSTCILTTKWHGSTADDVNVEVDLKGIDIGVTFEVDNTLAGSGLPTTIATDLEQLGTYWRTCIINTYSFTDEVMNILNDLNGVPSTTNPTGRYNPGNFCPFIAINGSVVDDPSGIIYTMPNEVTNCMAVAPGSLGMPYEAAANMAVAWLTMAANAPHGSTLGMKYVDMPAPAADNQNPSMNTLAYREYLLDRGCSTVLWKNGEWVIQDFVTSYNEEGEFPPFYAEPRTLNIDWNYIYGLGQMIEQNIQGKTLIADGAIVTVSNCISPKNIKSLIAQYNFEREKQALIANAAQSNKDMTVVINSQNPNRVDVEVQFYVTGHANIITVNALQSFYFG